MKKTEEIKKIIEHHRKLFYERDGLQGRGYRDLREYEAHKEIVFDEMCEAIETVCNRDADDSINDELWSNND